jgi:hypothetical protein
LRKAALDSHNQSNKIYEESVYDLYNMSVTARLALCKALVREAIANGTATQIVQVADPDTGKAVPMSKVDAIINQFAQSNVDMAMIRENIGQAKGFADLSWIYIESRTGAIELGIRDIREAANKSKQLEAINTLATEAAAIK